MNNDTRSLLREICTGDIRRVQKAAMVLMRNNKTAKDADFCANLLKQMESKADFIQLPQDLKGILVAEDVSQYPVEKFFWGKRECEIADKVISMYRVADRLQNKGIRYLPATILWGESGCGKTELARYIAYKVGLPYVYVRFSTLVDSHLGKTQKNIANVFDYVRKTPCVMCFDEIDAVGMERGQRNEVGEMARIVIALMQELDMIPNNVIIIGTTNRFDMLDKALIRRFPTNYQIHKLDQSDAKTMARRFLEYAGMESGEIDLYVSSVNGNIPASTIIRDCTEFVAEKLMKEQEIEYCNGGECK